MKRFNFKVEKTTDGYTAYYEAPGGGLIYTHGDNMTELKTNAIEALNETLDYQGKKSIDENSVFLNLDLSSFFDHYKVINASQLAAVIPMNRTLLEQYKKGDKKPSRKQLEKILNGVTRLGRELSSIEFA